MKDIELTKHDKKLLALAIQGICLRQGPKTWPMYLALAKKLEVQIPLENTMKIWLDYYARMTKQD